MQKYIYTCYYPGNGGTMAWSADTLQDAKDLLQHGEAYHRTIIDLETNTVLDFPPSEKE